MYLISKHLNKNKHHICQISNLILFSQIFLHDFPIAVFYTKRLTSYTISVYLNSFPLHDAVPQFCRNKTNTLLYRLVYRRSQSHCAPEQQWRCTVLTVGQSPPPPSHTERSSVPELTISVLSTSCIFSH